MNIEEKNKSFILDENLPNLEFKDFGGESVPQLRFKGFNSEWKKKLLTDASICINNLRTPLSSQERKNIKGIYPYFGATGEIDSLNYYTIDDEIIMLAEDCGNYHDFKNSPIAYYFKGKCVVNNHTHILKNNDKDILKCVLYSIIHKNITKHLLGKIRFKLTKGELFKITTFLPSKQEQEKIARFFSKMDDLIDLNEKKLENLKKTKEYYLSVMFPKDGELVPQLRFKGFDGEWEKKKLGDVCETNSGGNKLSDSKDDNGKYPFFVCSKKVEKINTFSYDEEAVLIASRGAGTGTVHYINGKFDYRMHVFKLNNSLEKLYFLYFYLETPESQKKLLSFSEGSAIPMITQTNLVKMFLFFPSLQEQEKIAHFFSKMDDEIDLQEKKIHSLKETKKYYLKNMFI